MREPLLEEPSGWEAESLVCEVLAHSPVNKCDGQSGEVLRGAQGSTRSGMFLPPSAPPIGQTGCHLGALAGTKKGQKGLQSEECLLCWTVLLRAA